MLSCSYIIKDTKEVSKTYEELKDFFKDYKFIFDSNEEITDKFVEKRDYSLEEVEDVEFDSESTYLKLRMPKFKSWFGFDFDTKRDLSVDELSIVNEQMEPKLFTEVIMGKTVAYFKNVNGEKASITSNSNLTNLNYTVAQEISNKVLYYIVESIRVNNNNLDLENLKIDNVFINSMVNEFIEVFEDDAIDNETVREGLDILTTHKEYISDLITTTIKDFSLAVKEVENEIEEDLEKDEKNEVVKKESTLVNSKNKATANVKLLLSFSLPKLKKVSIDGKLKNVVDTGNYFQGFYQFESFGRVWNILEPALANLPSIYKVDSNGILVTDKNGNPQFNNKKEVFFKKIEQQREQHEGIDLLLERFNELSEYELNEFFKAFSKSSKNYLTNQFEYDFEKADEGYVRKLKLKTITKNSNNNPEDLAFSAWGVEFKNKFVDGNVFKIPNSKEKLTKFTIDISEDKLNVNEVVNYLGSLGIDVNIQILNLAVKHKNLTSNEEITFEKYVGLLLKYINDINGRAAFNNYENSINPFMDFRNDFYELGLATVQVNGFGTENTSLGPKGMYWNYALTSYMDNVIHSTAQGDTSHLDGLDKNVWSKNSDLSNRIREGKIKLHTFLQLKKLGDKGLEESSINEHDNIILQVNRVLKNNIYNLFSPADKTTTFLMEGFDFTSTINDTWISKIKEYLKDEYQILKELGKTEFTLLDGNIDFSYFDEKGQIKEDEKVEALIEGYVASKVDEIIKEYNLVNEDGTTNEVATNLFFDNDLFNSKKYNKNVRLLLSDFVVNSKIALIETSKVFTGYAGYYKSIPDFTKRVPATQTDGVPLALTKGDPVYFNIAVIDAIEGIGSVIGSPENIERVYQTQRKYNPNVKKSDIEKSLLYYSNYNPNTKKRLDGVNIGDAQAWITLDRAEFLIRKSGKWNEKTEKVFAKAKSGQVLSEVESKYLALQPLKGVHFELIDGKPYFLKYSQAILIPSMIKGTPLERLNEAMLKDKNNIIDEVITKDGVKVGNENTTKIHNEKGELLENIVLNKTKLSNRYWKLQQELGSKKIKISKLASQIQKNIFADLVNILNNAPNAKVFNGLTASEVINEIKSTVTNILNNSNSKMLEKLGVEVEGDKLTRLNEDGLNVIKNLLLGQFNANEPAGVVQSVKEGIKLNAFGSSLDFLPTVKNRVQNVLASFFKKKQVDIPINQASFIQISNFAFGSKTKSHDLSDHKKQGIIFLKEVDELHGPILNEDNTLNKGQVLIPSFIFEKAYPGFRNYSKEIRKEILDNLDPRIFEVLGYRIPNQGLSSNDSLEVVGILPPEAGDSVVVYNGITTKTGSDFDIDKMYMMLPNIDIQYSDDVYRKAKNFIFNKKETFFNEITLEQLEEILDEFGIPNRDQDVINALRSEFINGDDRIDLDSLTNLNTDIELEIKNEKNKLLNRIVNELVKTPGNALHDEFIVKEGVNQLPKLVYATEGIKGQQNRLLELYNSILSSEINYYNKVKPIDETTQVIQKAIRIVQNLTGVNANKKLDIYSAVDQSKKRVGLLKGKQGVGTDANHLVNHPLTQLFNLKLNTKGITYELDKVYDNRGEYKITEILSGFLNAFVDIAKEDWILQGNVNASTFSALALALRSGVHINDIINLLMKPDVKSFIENESRAQANFLPDIKEQRVLPNAKLINKELSNFVKTGKINNDFLALDVFLKLKSHGKMLTKLIQASQFEVNGSGNTSAGLMSSIFKTVDLFEQLDLSFSESINDYFSSDSILGTRLKNNIIQRYEIERQLFFELDLINEIKASANLFGENKATDSEFVEGIVNSFKLSIYDGLFKQLVENEDALFTKEWSNQFKKIQSKYPNNELLKHLETKSTKDYEFLTMNTIRNMPKSLKDQMMVDLRDLLINEEQFANELIAKSFYQSGFNQGLGTFYEFIPVEFYNKYKSRIGQSIADFKSNVTIGEMAINHGLNNLDSVKSMTKDEFDAGLTSERNTLLKYKDKLYIPVSTIQLLNGTILYKFEVVKDAKYKYNKIGSTRYFSNTNLNLNQIEKLNKFTFIKDNLGFLKNLNSTNKTEAITLAKEEGVQIDMFEEQVNNINYYKGNITPEPNTIFVFGSNPEGRHGAGAAKVAKDKFGAIYGQGEGLQGNAYALPTKDLRIKENNSFKSISPEQITKSIEKLYEVAKANPNKQFKVAYRNTSEVSLNGYTGLEMIDMFNKAAYTQKLNQEGEVAEYFDIPSNVIFSKEWFDTGKLYIKTEQSNNKPTDDWQNEDNNDTCAPF